MLLVYFKDEKEMQEAINLISYENDLDSWTYTKFGLNNNKFVRTTLQKDEKSVG